MSTAQAVMMKQLEDQQRELNDLRRRVGPKGPDFAAIKSRQQVSIAELNALNKAQADGAFDNTPGLKEVRIVDITGRQSSHFFGDPGNAWNAFTGPALKTGRLARPQ